MSLQTVDNSSLRLLLVPFRRHARDYFDNVLMSFDGRLKSIASPNRIHLPEVAHDDHCFVLSAPFASFFDHESDGVPRDLEVVCLNGYGLYVALACRTVEQHN